MLAVYIFLRHWLFPCWSLNLINSLESTLALGAGLLRLLRVVPSTDVKYMKLSNICTETNRLVYHSFGNASAAPRFYVRKHIKFTVLGHYKNIFLTSVTCTINLLIPLLVCKIEITRGASSVLIWLFRWMIVNTANAYSQQLEIFWKRQGLWQG